jgi:hypothetical protein
MRKEVAFSFVKRLLKRMFAGCYIGRVRECLIFAGCTIDTSRSVRRLLYRLGAKMLIRGKNKHLLDACRRRNFHGEVASEWFGSYSLS